MKKVKKFNKWNIWKKIAIGCLIIFLIIILLNAVRIIKFKSESKSKFGSFVDLSQEQKDKTLSLLEKISIEEGYKLGDYDIKINPKIMEININNKEKKHILEVSLEKDTESRSYLIDTNTWSVLQSSKMNYSGWMATKDNQRFSHCVVPPKIFDIRRK